jgi:phosphoribosylaminoimidazole-succinocarboxamide synthase
LDFSLEPALLRSQLAHYPEPRRGKVRDVYPAGDGRLLIVATDRISAFDCILASGIPGKGRLLTQMSLFWFALLRDLTPNHLITADVGGVPDLTPGERDLLRDRIMYVHEARMVPVECVARGYLVGSGWKDYQRTGAICGIPLPPGLQDGSRLPEAIFTPATKAESGHDENISFQHVEQTVGPALAARLRELTLALYTKAAAHALSRGIILADTKFEFGFVGEDLVLADEALTPDSSRFWPLDQWKPGAAQVSLDKQYVRLYLETLDWNKHYPAPELPGDVIAQTLAKYQEAYARLTAIA